MVEWGNSIIRHLSNSYLEGTEAKAVISKEAEVIHIIQDRSMLGHFHDLDTVHVHVLSVL